MTPPRTSAPTRPDPGTRARGRQRHSTPRWTVSRKRQGQVRGELHLAARAQAVAGQVHDRRPDRSAPVAIRLIERARRAPRPGTPALAAVESENADAGIVYRTDAAVSKRVRVAFETRRLRSSIGSLRLPARRRLPQPISSAISLRLRLARSTPRYWRAGGLGAASNQPDGIDRVAHGLRPRDGGSARELQVETEIREAANVLNAGGIAGDNLRETLGENGMSLWYDSMV